MRRTFTLLFVAASLVAGGMCAEAAPSRSKAFSKKKAARIERVKAKAAARAAAVKYLPTKEELYVWEPETEEWILESLVTNTYTAEGKLATSLAKEADSDGVRQLLATDTYDSENRLIEVLTQDSDDSGATWTKTERQAMAYDDIVKDFRIENFFYRWDNDSWLLNYGNSYDIKRNDSKVVTGITRLAPLGDEMDPINKVENTVSADGSVVTASKVNELKYEGLDPVWETYVDLREIEWHNTDGQVIGFDIEDYARGANRIKYAKSYYEGELEALLKGEYANDFEGTLTFEFPDGTHMTIGTEYTEAGNGSYQETFELTYFEDEAEDDLNGDGIVNDDDRALVTEEEYYIVNYDDHGNLVLEQSTFLINGEVDFVTATRHTYTYNADGAATETISASYDSFTDEYTNEIRIVSSEFVTAAGVGNVVADNDAISVVVNGNSLLVGSPAAATADVVALDGRTLASAAGEGSFNVDITSLPAGVYVVRVATATATKSVKIAL